MTSLILTLDESNFEETLSEHNLLLLDFWAPWCGPCKQLNPLLEEIASDHKGSLTIAKVNVDDSPSLAQKYGVRGIPTLLLIHQGSVAATHVGLPSKEQIEDMISEFHS